MSVCLLTHVYSGLESEIRRSTSVASYKMWQQESVLPVTKSESRCKALKTLFYSYKFNIFGLVGCQITTCSHLTDVSTEVWLC